MFDKMLISTVGMVDTPDIVGLRDLRSTLDEAWTSMLTTMTVFEVADRVEEEVDSASPSEAEALESPSTSRI